MAYMVVPLESIQAINERFANTAYGFFLGKRVAYPVVANYFSYKDGLDAMLKNGPWFIRNNPLILKKWNPDLNLLKKDVGNVPIWVKLHGVPMTASSFARAIIELRVDVELKDTIMVAIPKLVDECPKNIGSDVAKNLKNHRQAARVAKRSKMRCQEKSSTSTTPIVERLDKLERQIIDGKLTLVDDDRNPLPKVVSMENANSDSEVEDVVNEHAGFMASTGLKRDNDSGYNTNNLLEQWRKTKRDDNYDPYDDDLYERHDKSDNLQAICDELDITVRGRKKK
ncbi:7-deoxyloganetin glucosyltransferase-like protein [Tanacetum coccineum]